MKTLYISFYAIYIFNYVLVSMMLENDCFYGLQDFKEFLSAWKNQVKVKYNQII